LVRVKPSLPGSGVKLMPSALREKVIQPPPIVLTRASDAEGNVSVV
jgi:hypothetical protein